MRKNIRKNIFAIFASMFAHTVNKDYEEDIVFVDGFKDKFSFKVVEFTAFKVFRAHVFNQRPSEFRFTKDIKQKNKRWKDG